MERGRGGGRGRRERERDGGGGGGGRGIGRIQLVFSFFSFSLFSTTCIFLLQARSLLTRSPKRHNIWTLPVNGM